MFAAIGNLKFELLLSPRSFSENRSYVFAEHAVALGRPTLQKIGEALRERSVSFLFHRGFCDPVSSIKSLYEIAEKQVAQVFVLGDGTFAGEYVIEKIEAVIEKLDDSGAPIWIGASLGLREVAQAQVVTAMRKASKEPQPQPGAKVRKVPDRKSAVVAENREKLAATG